MKGLLSKLTNSTLDLLLPLQCLGCRQGGNLLCPTCVATLPRLAMPYCAICASPCTGQRCHWCSVTPLEIDGLRAPFHMEGLIREAIHHFKYRNVRAAAPELGSLLAQYLDSHSIPGEVLVSEAHRREGLVCSC